jgi:cell division protein FtsQ
VSLQHVDKQVRKSKSRRLIIGFFVLIGCIVILESPLTRVRSIRVTGNRSIPSSQILNESSLLKGMSLWQVSGQAVEERIKAVEPLVESVVTSTDYLHGVVTVRIIEKRVVAVYVESGKSYLLLNDGVVYTETSSSGGFTWPIVTADVDKATKIGEGVANPYVGTLCRQLARISPSFISNLSELHVDKFGVVSLYLNNGFEVQCRASDFQTTVPDIDSVIHYFSGKGYAPGLIDMTGQPPYRYTPFQDLNGQGGSP